MERRLDFYTYTVLFSFTYNLNINMEAIICIFLS